MTFVVQNQSLSALKPVKFAYRYNSEELFDSDTNLFKSNFSYYKHELLNQFQDAAFSKQNCIVLTDTKKLNSVFKNKVVDLSIGQIPATVYLKTKANYFLTETDGLIYVGGTGERLMITLDPVRDNIVELNVGSTERYIKIDSAYPYTATVEERILSEEELYLAQFEVDYENGFLTLKATTPEGPRYLSHGADRVLRAVGLEMNDMIINSYKFIPEFITSSSISYDFDPTVKEIKYYNEISSVDGRKNLLIKTSTENDTNLLVSCPTVDLSLESLSSVSVNIAIAKTNFSSSGTYSPSI
jgi:hypothetical protein